jgi:hypothetical protein
MAGIIRIDDKLSHRDVFDIDIDCLVDASRTFMDWTGRSPTLAFVW